MISSRFGRSMAAVALVNGVLALCVVGLVEAGEREEMAKKYAEQLRKGKDAKTRVKALQGLGELAQVKKSLVADALPDIYKAAEDKDPAVRAAAAETLGKADEPYGKAGPVLGKMLKEEKDANGKIGALRGLTAMGASAKDSAPAIREIVRETKGDKKSKLGVAAKDALKAVAGGKKQ